MNIKKLWKSLFKKTDSDETPAAAQVWQPLVGSNMSSAFAEIPEVYQSILFISTNATQAELGYFRFKDNAEVYRDNPQVRPLSELLDRPNPEMDLNTFLEFVYGFLAYHREVFILKVKSRGQLAGTRNLPAQLWPVNPKDCAAASFDAWGVSAWSIKGVIYPAEDVIHIRYFNPVDMFRSVSPLTPLAELIKANKAAMKSNRAFYENNSQAPFILATDRDLTKTQMDAIKDAWEAGHKGSEKRGNTGFLSGGLKPYAINTNNGTAEFVENSKNTSERILSGLQMQKALLNMTDTTNYATYMGQLRTFWQNVIRPMVRKVESALNTSVVRPFAPELELRFKYDNVEAFQADFADKVNTAKTLASIGYPINKISDRLNLGFEPVMWGDDWWINFGLVPASDYRAGIMAAVLAFADGFATGGVVPGNSFSGDNVLARVNSGEMILNRAQQARLFDIADGNAEPGWSGGAVINQTINVQNGGDLTAITQAIKRGTIDALEFANVAYKAGAKRNKYVG